ncbi:alpha/beta hydrolase fold domain-containing protein [Streptomyces griseorubiginosus]|uniref:alpha/beta hydrolase fold domain-containing protein n=1 Tax=Streptomyces griseorubiginosus TaxID=67304 RepID=UPI001FEC07AC|nr:alpha/beta hydrolase fold domain-containing protein [Streptomyces griseorubiginosus]
MPQFRADAFGPGAVPEDVAAFNAAMGRQFGDPPDIWDVGIDQARSGGFMPLPPPSPRAFDIQIADHLSLHVVPNARPRAVLLHIHGGGFVLGGAAHQDVLLERMADAIGATCVSEPIPTSGGSRSALCHRHLVDPGHDVLGGGRG